MPTPELSTPRLRLLAWTAESAAASLADRALLARVLDADVPADWPPRDLADVESMLADGLRRHPDQAGWWGWYMIARSGVVAPRATLVGSLGCSRFGPKNRVQFGYGILPAFERRGLTGEAAVALIEWALRQPGVSEIEATTFERHTASVRILERCGFACLGVAPNDAEADENDRQGRGRLLLFVRRRDDASPPAP